MIIHFGKKVHIWPRSRHDSINENEVSNNPQNVCHTSEPQENFRSRSKSLDVQSSRKILDDCEATYKIYNRILKEGKKYIKNIDNLMGIKCFKKVKEMFD